MPGNYTRKPNCVCAICAKPLYRRPKELARGKVYCGRECVSVAQTIWKECPVCGTRFKSGLNKTACSHACSNIRRTGITYRTGRSGCNATRVRRLKRLLIELYGPRCNQCGYDNLNILQVHHRVPRAHGGTDDLDNLDILCPNCHMTDHHGDSRLAESQGIEPCQP